MLIIQVPYYLLSYRLYSISTTPMDNREVAASVVCAIRPKARLLKMKSVRSLEP
jgi:hypothetical protein